MMVARKACDPLHSHKPGGGDFEVLSSKEVPYVAFEVCVSPLALTVKM